MPTENRQRCIGNVRKEREYYISSQRVVRAVLIGGVTSAKKGKVRGFALLIKEMLFMQQNLCVQRLQAQEQVAGLRNGGEASVTGME